MKRPAISSLARAGMLVLVLLFGTPAAALLLAHLGVIRLPADADLGSVTDASPAAASDGRRVLEESDAAASPRAAAARAAIIQSAAHLPGHEPHTERKWTFRAVRRAVFPVGSAPDAAAGAPIYCDGCDTTLHAWARVQSLGGERAQVLVDWMVLRERNRPGRVEPAAAKGSLDVTLELDEFGWRAVDVVPRE